MNILKILLVIIIFLDLIAIALIITDKKFYKGSNQIIPIITVILIPIFYALIIIDRLKGTGAKLEKDKGFNSTGGYEAQSGYDGGDF